MPHRPAIALPLAATLRRLWLWVDGPLLRRNLAAWVVAAIAAATALVAGEALDRSMEAKGRAELAARAEVGAGMVEQLTLRRLEAVDMMHRLAQSWFALRSAGNAEGEATIRRELARSTNDGQFGFVQIAIIDREGWMIWSSVGDTTARVWLGDREHFQVHRDGRTDVFVSKPVLGRVSNRWTIQLTRPLQAPGQPFAGVAVVSLDLLNLSDAIAEVHFNGADRGLIFHRDGAVAARSSDPERFIGRPLRADDPLMLLPIDRTSGAVERQGPDQRPVIAGWRAVGGTPLVAAYIMDMDEAMAETASARLLVRAMAAAVALAAFAVTGLFVLRSERRLATLAARQSEAARHVAEAAHALYARRIAGLPAVVYSGRADAQGFRLAQVSESLERIAGWTPAELPAAGGWQCLMEPEQVGEAVDFLKQVLIDGQGVREHWLRRRDGERIWVRHSVRIVERDAAGAEVVGYVADITGEREMRMKAEASGKLATLGEMATGLAHELNQPLAVMSLAADNADRALEKRGEAAIADVRQRLARIAQQAQRARGIVDHLRLYGRNDEGAPEPTALPAAVEGALVLTAAALRAAGIVVETQVPDTLPLVQARLVPLEQALVNLLLNARDAVEERRARDGAPGRVAIAVTETADAVNLTVADNGGGVPPAVMGRLFEPFFTTKPPGKGTGLGLPICRSTMLAFGGDIAVANDADGAVFTLTFQRAELRAAA